VAVAVAAGRWIKRTAPWIAEFESDLKLNIIGAFSFLCLRNSACDLRE
jgi:hypothetical protein